MGKVATLKSLLSTLEAMRVAKVSDLPNMLPMLLAQVRVWGALRSALRKALAGELLARKLHLLRRLRLLHLLLLLLEEELDVARARLVRRHAAVSTVRAAAARRRAVARDVRDDRLLGVEVLRLRVRLRVLQQADEHLHALLRPPTLRVLELVALRRAADAAAVAAERNDALLLEHRLKVRHGLGELHALHRLAAVVHVLVVRRQVHRRGLRRPARVLGLRAVLDLPHLSCSPPLEP